MSFLSRKLPFHSRKPEPASAHGGPNQEHKHSLLTLQEDERPPKPACSEAITQLQPHIFPLLKLPPELLSLTFFHCDLVTRRALSLTSKYFYDLAEELCSSIRDFTKITLPLYAGPLGWYKERLLEGLRQAGVIEGHGPISNWGIASDDLEREERYKSKLRKVKKLLIGVRAEVQLEWSNVVGVRKARERTAGISDDGSRYLCSKKEVEWLSEGSTVSSGPLGRNLEDGISEMIDCLKENLEEVRMRIFVDVERQPVLERYDDDIPRHLESALYQIFAMLLKKPRTPNLKLQIALYGPVASTDSELDSKLQRRLALRIISAGPFRPIEPEGQIIHIAEDLTQILAHVSVLCQTESACYRIPTITLASDVKRYNSSSVPIPESDMLPDDSKPKKALSIINRVPDLPGTSIQSRKCTPSEFDRNPSSTSTQILTEPGHPINPQLQSPDKVTSRLKSALSLSTKSTKAAKATKEWRQQQHRSRFWDAHLPVLFLFSSTEQNYHPPFLYAISSLHLEGLALEFQAYRILASLRKPASVVLRNLKLVQRFPEEYEILEDGSISGHSSWDNFFIAVACAGGRVGHFEAERLWERIECEWVLADSAPYNDRLWRGWLSEGLAFGGI